MYQRQTVENILTIIFLVLTTKIEVPCLVIGSFSMSLYANKTVPANILNRNLEDGDITSSGRVLTSNISIGFPKSIEDTQAAEKRLRDRWKAFMAEATKEISFDHRLSSPSVVTAITNRDLLITCATNRPLRGQYRLSFIRLKDFSLLFVGERRHMRDPRYQVLHSAEEPNTWSLQIRNVQESDAGKYECQINTEPKPITHTVQVKVVAGHIWILPSDPVVHVGTGGQLNLDCVVDTGPVLPQFILWYRDNRIIEYSENVDAEVTLHLNETLYNNSISSKSMTLNSLDKATHQKASYIQHRSHLLVRSVSPSDTGLYRCDSDLTGEAFVQVYVVPPEDLMKSLHLQGAVEKSDSSQTLQKYRVEKSQRTRVTKNDKHSSFTSRVDDSHGSNSFYDHPTKSHSQNYKNYKKNQTINANVPWMISSSSPLSLSKSDPKYASYILIVAIMKMLICVIIDVSYL